MPTYNVSYDRVNKIAYVLDGSTVGPDAVAVGTIEHDDEDDLGYGINHVLFHHVQELLYHRSVANPAQSAMFPNNIHDMANVTILREILPVGIEATPATVSLVEGATQQITVASLPAAAKPLVVTYESEDTDIATVNSSGLITAVAAGTTNIKVSSVSGGYEDSVAVTVTAE